MRPSCSCTPTASPSCRCKEKTLIWHLYQAALAGRDIFYDQRYAHNLEMRDVLEAVLTHKAGIDPATLSEIEQLHEALLDQQRPVQQPDRAQIRADVHARGVRRRRAGGRAAPARNFRSRAARRSISCSRALQPMFFDPAVDPMVTNKTPPRAGHPRGERQQPLRRPDDEGPRGVQGSARAQLAAREAERRRSSKRCTASTAATAARSPRSCSTSRPPSRLRPSRWPKRSRALDRSSTRPARRPTARRTTSPGCRTRLRPWTRSTGSSRCIWTRAASRARGKPSSST